jgi:dTDP-4-dehydrorhamnose reductase
MILLLGATGYVGKAFAKYFKSNDIDFLSYSIRFPLNTTELRKICLRNKVSTIYNCAAYVGKPNVDACELNKDAALMANALLPQQLLKFCNDYAINLVHVSSGCIFTDSACDQALAPTREYTEKDEPNFCFDSSKYSWYSGTKALGEQLINRDYNVTIVRLRIPFDGENDDRNYISKIIKYPILLNATNSFSQLNEFVAAAHNLQHAAGIFNLTQPGYLTTKQVVEMLAKHNLVSNKLYFKNIEDFEKTVATPRSNCVLDSSNAIREGIKLTLIEDAMQQAIDEYAFNLKQHA